MMGDNLKKGWENDVVMRMGDEVNPCYL